MMVTRKKSDEPKKKPCGIDGYCPIVDEMRPFSDGYEELLALDNDYAEIRKIAAIIISKWCNQLASLQVVPSLTVCRTVTDTALLFSLTKEPKDQIRYLCVALAKEIKKLEKETAAPGDVHALIDSLMRDLETKGVSF